MNNTFNDLKVGATIYIINVGYGVTGFLTIERYKIVELNNIWFDDGKKDKEPWLQYKINMPGMGVVTNAISPSQRNTDTCGMICATQGAAERKWLKIAPEMLEKAKNELSKVEHEYLYWKTVTETIGGKLKEYEDKKI